MRPLSVSSRLLVILVLLGLSCSSTKETRLAAGTPKEKKQSELSLPVCLNFTPAQHDSIVQRMTTYFNEKNIGVISKEKMFDLVQIEYRSAMQSANIAPGSTPESRISQVERKTKYVSNLLRIDFTFVSSNTNQFVLKWHNELMPMKLTTYKKSDWTQVDSLLLNKFSWPESLRVAVESIIVSGKLQ